MLGFDTVAGATWLGRSGVAAPTELLKAVWLVLKLSVIVNGLPELKTNMALVCHPAVAIFLNPLGAFAKR